MFNLLRMDLYRMKRTKSVYICFSLMLLAIFMSYVMFYLLEVPEGQKTAMRIGMLALAELEEGHEMLEGMDLLGMFREANMDGGVYNVLMGVAVALFVCADYKGGAMKNIMALRRERWTYVASKLTAAGILNALYLVLGFGFNFLMNLSFGNIVPITGWDATLFYLGWTWLVTTAFAAMVIFLCVVTRNLTVGVLGAVLGASGIVVLAVSTFMGYFRLGGWLPYTLYYNMTAGPSAYSSPGDLKAVAVGAVFLAIYSVAAILALKGKDI